LVAATAAAGLLDQDFNRDRRCCRNRSLVGVKVILAPRRWYYADSTMTMRRVNKDDSVALYDVVAAELRRAIAEGEAGPGERMPRAVDLAAILGVNKNTVIRALHILRDEGLLDFTRGRGVRVVGTPQKSAVLTRIDDLLEFARSQGYKREEVAAMIAGQESR
jgi:GntR family transcriptional regulator